MIFLTNTLTGKKEQFSPIDPHKVLLYVCGITPYDFAHIGHGRCYITFDMLYRLLKLYYKQVVYCRNFTDIDDKLLDRAQREFGDQMRYHEVAQKFMIAYEHDVKRLNCLSPEVEPLATQAVPGIITFIEGLIAQGAAYQVEGDVYFRIKSCKDYGILSKRNTQDLRAGARVEINERKEDPLDFALWKGEPDGLFWKSPWGYGRPGWHIECSVMSSEHLGKHIDIHGGGMDLIFPHHENEKAQSEALQGAPFVRYWVHNAFVRINQEKMSKSLGNFFTLRDVFETFDPQVVRFYILQHHYRSPLDFAYDDIIAAQKAYMRLCKIFAASTCPASIKDEHVQESMLVKKLLHVLSDDLNTPGVLGVIFENLADLQEDLCAVKIFIQEILGLTLELLPEPEIMITAEIQELLDQRERARVEKNFKRADELREQLQKLGYNPQDKKL